MRHFFAWMVLMGCGGVTSIPTTVTHPAPIPVYTYPNVMVVASSDPATHRIALSAGAYLARNSESKVSYPTHRDIAQQRARQQVPNGSVVMEVRTEFQQGFTQDWRLRPRTVCGPGGCVTRERRVWVQVPTLLGRVRVHITDGPTGSELQSLSFAVKQQSRNGYIYMRNRAVVRLVEAFQARLMPRVEKKKVTLRRIDELPRVQHAIELASQEKWHAGRKLLEQSRKSEEVRLLPAHVLAKFYYNLALFRHHDPAGFETVEARVTSSRNAMRRAVALDSKSFYVNALAELVEDGRRQALLDQQDIARRHNFKLRGVRERAPVPAHIPPAPDDYRNADPGVSRLPSAEAVTDTVADTDTDSAADSDD